MFDFKKLILSLAVCVLLIGLFRGIAYAAEESTQSAVINRSVVNLRDEANTSSKVLAKLPKGTVVSVIKNGSQWVNVKFEDQVGFVNAEYITLRSSLGTATVFVDVLNLRSKPDTTSNVVSKLQKNDRLTLLDKSEDWYKVKTSEGDKGWVSAEYISLKKTSVSRGDDVDRDDSSDLDASNGDSQIESELAQKIVSYAKRFLGQDYVYGGDTPKEGFDCSGFTKYVFNKFGMDLERTAADQGTQGTKVLKSDLMPGDLVFFDTNGGYNHINHVGIYIGGGRFIHASSPRRGVIITDLSEVYYKRAYMRSRRIINP